MAGAAAMLALMAPAVAGAATTTYTYTYTGPAFSTKNGNLSVVITTGALLSVNSSYSGLPAGTTVATIKVNGNGSAGMFSLPIQVFSVTTDSAGNIASWVIQADSNNFTKTTPATGTDHYASTVNTLSQTVALPKGYSTRSATDQGLYQTYYKSCTGVSGCTVSGTGQPYTVGYNGYITNTTGKWVITRSTSGGGCGGQSGTGCGGGGGGRLLLGQ